MEEKENVVTTRSSGNVEGSPGDFIYKKLYHSSLDTCGNLEQQLLKYSGLLSKLEKIVELKVSSHHGCNPLCISCGEFISHRVKFCQALLNAKILWSISRRPSIGGRRNGEPSWRRLGSKKRSWNRSDMCRG